MMFCGLFPEPEVEKPIINGSPVRTNLRSKYSSGLSSYTSACQKDSNLKSFDSSLHHRTNEVIRSIAGQAETRSLSLDSLMEVYGFLLELSQDAVKLIVESEEDVWENKDLRSLVGVYFKSTSETLGFFNIVQNCVKKTEISQIIIRFAVKQFEAESEDTDLGGNKKKKKYAKTLEELNKFYAMGNPFGDDFLAQYESVYEQQLGLLEELGKLKVKLDKRHRNIKTGRRLVNAVFATAFVSVLVLSVVLTALTAPPVVSAVASALTAPLEIVGKWCNDMWKEYEKAVKKQKLLVTDINRDTRANKEETETIRILVETLRNEISLILKTVEFAVEREENEAATRFAMKDIKKRVEGFAEKMEEVGEKAAKCSKSIISGRLVVVARMRNLPANSLL